MSFAIFIGSPQFVKLRLRSNTKKPSNSRIINKDKTTDAAESRG